MLVGVADQHVVAPVVVAAHRLRQQLDVVLLHSVYLFTLKGQSYEMTNLPNNSYGFQTELSSQRRFFINFSRCSASAEDFCNSNSKTTKNKDPFLYKNNRSSTSLRRLGKKPFNIKM